MRLLKHSLLSALLGCLIFGLLIAIDEILHEPGDIFSPIVFFIFPLIAIGLIVFYVLTNYHNAFLACINLGINIFVFRFQIDFLIENRMSGFLLFLVGSVLWAINKLMIDKLIDNFKVKRKPINKLDTFIHRIRKPDMK
ncbi:MAG: hypothetical protein IT236_04230 [Bacteroidia bacterium]|nr:hypothetical protein [Bacteroidia bacterium]